MSKTMTITAPAHWASAILNMDYSGLEKEEIGQVNNFLLDNGFSFSDCLDCEYIGFMHNHDAWKQSPFAGDCCAFIFPVSD